MAERSKVTELSGEPEKRKDDDEEGSLPRTKIQILPEQDKAMNSVKNLP